VYRQLLWVSNFWFCTPVQALNIPTKINRGTVEIVSDVHLIKAGEKVGGSEATLLSKLGIKPFSYGLVLLKVCRVHLAHSLHSYS